MPGDPQGTENATVPFIRGRAWDGGAFWLHQYTLGTKSSTVRSQYLGISVSNNGLAIHHSPSSLLSVRCQLKGIPKHSADRSTGYEQGSAEQEHRPAQSTHINSVRLLVEQTRRTCS